MTLENAVRRVNYCSTIIPDEFDRLSPKEFFSARRLPFNYPFDRDVCRAEAIPEDPIAQGKGILIGNSATFENNHADLFELLHHLPLAERQIIVPLNYGDRVYAHKIARLGNECFGANFRPLLDFMPFPQYTELLRSCSAAIFYHERQQAFGSVILALWNGSKVFMSKTSILYTYLRKRGIVLFTIPDDLNEASLAAPMPRDAVIANRTILSEEYSYAAIRAKIAADIDQIGKDRETSQ
ncbi:MAG TPA: TDP-N-acetylfucosamine:lipid II N-acetylfucosaminyltransferase [bacterium]|nr:TDP-N-acetylfucosamine:lipid II N-acetylfucosaminyltransferase [bacterium]